MIGLAMAAAFALGVIVASVVWLWVFWDDWRVR